jgi:hypothetical protein
MYGEAKVVIVWILGGSAVFNDDRPRCVVASLLAFLLSEESVSPYLVDVASKVGKVLLVEEFPMLLIAKKM